MALRELTIVMITIKECNLIKLQLLTKHGTMQRNAWEWEEITRLAMDLANINQITDVNNKEIIMVITMTLQEDTTCLLGLEVKMLP